MNITIVVVTHLMEVIKQICNKVAFLKDGRVLSVGKPEELFVAPNQEIQKFVGDDIEILPQTGKNIKLFFMDVFGRKEQFDSQANNGKNNYRYMIPSDYEKSFHTAVQNGNGFNIYDSLTKAMKAKGLDKDNKKLYKDLNKLSKKLYKKGALTEAEANKKRKIKIAGISTVAILGVLGTTLGIIFGIKHKNKQKELQEQIDDQIEE